MHIQMNVGVVATALYATARSGRGPVEANPKTFGLLSLDEASAPLEILIPLKAEPKRRVKPATSIGAETEALEDLDERSLADSVVAQVQLAQAIRCAGSDLRVLDQIAQ